jgi:hypothetical protein
MKVKELTTTQLREMLLRAIGVNCGFQPRKEVYYLDVLKTMQTWLNVQEFDSDEQDHIKSAFRSLRYGQTQQPEVEMYRKGFWALNSDGVEAALNVEDYSKSPIPETLTPKTISITPEEETALKVEVPKKEFSCPEFLDLTEEKIKLIMTRCFREGFMAGYTASDQAVRQINAIAEKASQAIQDVQALTQRPLPYHPEWLAVREASGEVSDSNLTRDWIGQNAVALREYLLRFLPNHLPISKKGDMIEDHIQTFLLNLMNRKALDEDLRKGVEPPFSKILLYAKRSSYSQIQKMGIDAHTRTFFGAKTEVDRKKPKPEIDVNVHIKDPSVTYDCKEHTVLDFVGGDLRQEIENKDSQLKEMETKLRKSLDKKIAKQCIDIMYQVASGFSINEIATNEDISTNRVHTLISQIQVLANKSKTNLD